MNAATGAPKPASGIDSPENRAYIQKNRLWTLGEVLSAGLMTSKPADPIAKILELLEPEREKRTEQVDSPALDLVNDAKAYMTELRIAFLFEDWLKALLEARPEKPVEFSIDFFRKIQAGKGGKSSAAAASAGTVVIAFDGASPNTATAARAASVGVVELGFTAVVRAVGDVTAQELLGANALIVVAGAAEANDAAMIAKLAPAGAQLAGAVIVAAPEASDERVSALAAIFGRVVLTDKAAAVAAGSGSAVAASRGRALLIVQQDEGSAAAANVLGRTIVDQSK